MYYIRKLSNNPNIYKLKNTKNIESIDADILRQEFGTSNNTLSFWQCDNYNCEVEKKNAMKAILLSTSAIKTSQFIIIEDNIAKKYGLKTDDSEPGNTGYEGYEGLHINIVDLTYKKIGDVIEMLCEVVKNKDLTPKLEKEIVKCYIREVMEEDKLNESKIHKDLMKDINKYLR